MHVTVHVTEIEIYKKVKKKVNKFKGKHSM